MSPDETTHGVKTALVDMKAYVKRCITLLSITCHVQLEKTST